MKYGICELASVPVRIQPGDQYEMINQLIFGDVVVVLDVHKNWLLIESADDQYDGWIDVKQITPIDNNDYENLITLNRFYSLELSTICFSKNGANNLIIPFGSRIPLFHNGQFKILKKQYHFEGKVWHAYKKANREELGNIAKMYLGVPYLWGGRSPFGIDCSGLIQMVFKMCGIFLPRDSAQQVLQGNTINFIHEARTGDLAFFDNDEGKIIHVGIILENNKIIHASGKVRIDNIDHQGIFNNDVNQYTHNLRVIKSFFE